MFSPWIYSKLCSMLATSAFEHLLNTCTVSYRNLGPVVEFGTVGKQTLLSRMLIFCIDVCRRQHDAQEFLVHLLQALQKDLSRVLSTRSRVFYEDSHEWDALP